jgi:nuclear pore complex protein Nup205
MESLERLQDLHADLVAFTETRLANIERLWQELEDSLLAFRNLLDKPTIAPSDREAYNAGKITVEDQEYSINDEFRHFARALATSLDVDELEAAKILIADSGVKVSADLDFLAYSVARFHDRRDLTLQNLRLLLQESQNFELEPPLRDGFTDALKYVLDINDGVVGNASLYIKKCLDTMKTIEQRHLTLVNQIVNRPAEGELARLEYFALLEFQKDSIFKQHEALACILTYLFRGDYSTQEDLRKIEAATTEWNRLDLYLIHYLPVYSAAFRRFGSGDALTGLTSYDQRSLNSLFGTLKHDRSSTTIDPFLASTRLFWTAEYAGALTPGRESDEELKSLSAQMKSGLQDHALEFLLAVCSALSVDMWRHPARQEMVDLLLSEAPSFSFDTDQPSNYFREMCMESIEIFSESWISNLPDSIRQLKNEEDNQRLLRITAMQDGAGFDPMNEPAGPLHLESFLILISFAFEGRPEAAEQWWEDPESNLYGFLQWASKRQTVPRVGAFCEMLCSIADGPDGAAAVHKFLLEESVPVANSRTRRMPSLNFSQIFAELELYSRKVHEKAPTSLLANRKVLPTDMNESESPVMLSTYLRMLAHLCRTTAITRDYLYSQNTLDLARTLLLLVSGPVPSYLRASAFTTLEALLTEKDLIRTHAMWITIDEWASSPMDVSNVVGAKTGGPPTQTLATVQNTLGSLSLAVDQYDAFIGLLKVLLTPIPSGGPQSPVLGFPEDLGSTYRPAGVGPYIDFVCGQIFVKRLPEIAPEPQALRCTFHCLDLVATVLESFSESYVAMLDRTMNRRDSSPEVVRAITYAQRHPFARTMQWLLGSDMNGLILKRLQSPIVNVDAASPDSPLVKSLQRSIDIVNLALDLQPTYFDLVRPLQKDGLQERVAGAQSSIEDGVFANSGLILDLCLYCAGEHLELALRSLSLLQKLSASAKLNNHFLHSGTTQRRTERIIDMLGTGARASLKTVSETLVSKLQVSPRELEAGYESSGYLMKDGILAFLNTCLETQPELTNIAHLLLGFTRLGERLVLPDSSEEGVTVFDAIIELVQGYPHGEQGAYVSWLVHIKSAAIRTLQNLWTSSFTTQLTMPQLRRYRLLQSLFGGQETVSSNSRWDGKHLHEPDFWYTPAADTLAEVLSFRSSVYLYACQELQTCATEGLTISLKQYLSTMLGKSVDFSGTALSHANVFELGDFLDLDLQADLGLPPLEYFNGLDPELFVIEATEHRPSLYDISIIQEVVQTRQKSIYERSKPGTASAIDLEQVDLEAEEILATVAAQNRAFTARKAWRDALHSYVDMLIAIIEHCPFEDVAKIQFIIQNLQLILPKLDTLIAAESSDSVELARAADSLMFALISSNSSNQGRTENIITDKLFQLFRTCIDGILMTNSDPPLRSTLYSIASQYLLRILASSPSTPEANNKARTNSMDTIRSSSLRLITILADDAEDGTDTCRLNAFTLLSQMSNLARLEKSSYILTNLVKANILTLLIEPLKHISQDFQSTEPAFRSSLLQTFQARMFLLLQLSRTRAGATAILDAGIMGAVRESMLFRADPDLGFTTASTIPSSTSAPSSSSSAAASMTNALQTYLNLLSPTLRLLLSLLTVRGTDNLQSHTLARNFLAEARPNMVGLFKQHLGVTGAHLVSGNGNGNTDSRSKSKEVLEECVRSYIGLCVLAGFAEWEDEVALAGLRGEGNGNGNGFGLGMGGNGGFT